MTHNFFHPKIRIFNSFTAMYATCMPTCQTPVKFVIVSPKNGRFGPKCREIIFAHSTLRPVSSHFHLAMSNFLCMVGFVWVLATPHNNPNVSCQIVFLDVFSQYHSSNLGFDFHFFTGIPQFSPYFGANIFKLIGSTGPVFHEESGHAIKISHRPLKSGEIMA